MSDPKGNGLEEWQTARGFWNESGDVCKAVADTDGQRQLQQNWPVCEVWRRLGDCGGQIYDAIRGRYRTPDEEIRTGRNGVEHAGGWPTEPDLGRVAHELAFGMDIIGANEA